MNWPSIFRLVLSSCCLSLTAQAGDAVLELRQDMMPIVITEPGSYRAVENLSLGQLFIEKGSVWTYLDNGSNQGTNWISAGFDDSSWSSGPGPLGFGESGMGTDIDDNNQVTTYFRKIFTVDDPSAFGDMEVLVSRDDGFVAYLNGTEVARDNLPGGSITFTTPASSSTSGSKQSVDERRYRSFDVDHTLLQSGTNVFAVEVHNVSSADSDFRFDAILSGGFSGADEHGIQVLASGVTINLNGFVLQGVPGETDDGIRIDPMAKNVEVYNGIIDGWGGNGIDAGDIGTIPTREATGSVFRLLRISDSFGDGLQAGPNTFVDRVTSSGNGRLSVDFNYEVGVGIKVYRGSLVSECIVHNNHSHGILLRSRGEAHNCIVYHNGHDGVHGGRYNLVTGTVVTKGEVNADGIETDGDSLVMNSISYDNSDDGMKSRTFGHTAYIRCLSVKNAKDGLHTERDGNLVIECITADNGDDGIVIDDAGALGGNSLVAYNLSYLNGFREGGTEGGGIRLGRRGNWVHSNHLVGNERGIETVDSGLSLITGNSATGNDIDYDIDNTSATGSIEPTPGPAGPWDNFDY